MLFLLRTSAIEAIFIALGLASVVVSSPANVLEAGLFHFVTVNCFTVESADNAAASLAITVWIHCFAHLLIRNRVINLFV